MVNLTIGGGSFRGISYLGSLEYLCANNLLDNLEYFYGTSIGSIIGIMYIIKYTPIEIFNIIKKLNLDDYWKFNFDNINKKYSLISDDFFKKLKSIFSEKENPNITIKQFVDKYKININIFATELKSRKIIMFNIDTYPDVEVLKAVQASSSIPIIFPPTIIDDKYYLDGCVKNIDGIDYKIVNEDKNIHFVIKGTYEYENVNKVSEYLFELLQCVTSHKLQNENKIESEYVINIDRLDEHKNKIDFSIGDSEKIKLFYYGIKCAKKKFNNISELKQKILNNELMLKSEKLILEKVN